MCGIIGYSGNRPAVPLLIEGLHRLEYRGYDSSGVAYCHGDRIQVYKTAGKLCNLEACIDAGDRYNALSGIGHTRWATHGLPVERNAHPHLSEDGGLAIVHNGIIENFQNIKDGLTAKGHDFLSETDTEVLAHLIGEERRTSPSLLDAFAKALRRAKGAYAVAMISPEEDGVLYAARMAAPLIFGTGEGECFIASDIPAFLPYTRKVVFLNDGEIVRLERGKWEIFRLEDMEPVSRKVTEIEWDMRAAAKDGFKHFMLKEIMEQPRVIEDCLRGRIVHGNGAPCVRLQELDPLPVPDRLHIVACGTSYNAGLWARELFEHIAGIPVSLDIASEFRYRDPVMEQGEVVMVISQSGETADTLAALRMAQRKGCTVIGLCNVLGSSIAREADVVLYTQAGPEISVASTKAMCSQMALLTLMAVYFGRRTGREDESSRQIIEALEALPGRLKELLPELSGRARELAKKFAHVRGFFYIGRGRCEALAYEGALKLKEISYIHAEGYAAGEMKHGPIALVDSSFATFALAPADALFPKVRSNVQEVLARKGRVVALVQASEADGSVPQMDAEEVWALPASHPVAAGFLVLPALQLFSYYMADYLGNDIDQPRNLAKSVTVE